MSNETRDWKLAAMRGFSGRCPSCGEAKLFGRFLKPQERCPRCRQEWSHHSADDFPSYLVIFITGHVLVTAMITVNGIWDLPVGIQIAVWPLLALVMALALLQPVKGAVIGAQWALRMGGFAKDSSIQTAKQD